MKDNSFQTLSKRQIEIAELVRKGFTDKDIANALEISVHTVKSHLKRIYETMEVSGRTEPAGLSEWKDDDASETFSDDGALSAFAPACCSPRLRADDVEAWELADALTTTTLSSRALELMRRAVFSYAGNSHRRPLTNCFCRYIDSCTGCDRS
jgi:DNA-binding CsgD family transcriptional regulator